MGYDQKALEKLFAKKPELAEADAEQPEILIPELDSKPEAESNYQKTNAIKADAKRIIEVPLAELSDYPKQLFKPYTEEKLNKLEMSIRENGVIYPLIVRIVDGAYQIVCGHNRKRAAAQAGFKTVPCIEENMSDDEADMKMVETNLQSRTGLLPSEKGFAYKLKLDAMKHQGIRTDLTSTTAVVEVKGKVSADAVGEQVGESGSSINNYIRLTYLITPLLDLVDNNSLQLKPAVELSYMSLENQETVYNYFYVLHKLYIDELLAKRLKEQSRVDNLTEEEITALIPHSEGKTVKQTSKFSIPTKPLMKLLDTNALAKDIEKEILDVLIEYFQRKKNGVTN